MVAAVTLVGRAAGCERAEVVLSVRGREQRRIRFGRRAVSRTVAIAPPAGAERVRLRAAGCPVRIASITTTAPVAPTPSGVPLGTAIQAGQVGMPDLAAAVTSTFRSLTPENELKWARTEPQMNQYDFRGADTIVDFATAHGLAVRGHTLVYPSETPYWVRRLVVADLIRKALVNHIAAVIGRYRTRIREWDVVNEALDWRGQFQRNTLFNALGPGYVEDAFRAARAADPKAKLFYNENGIEGPGPKQEAALALVADLARKGLIDGVGLQMHTTLGAAPSEATLLSTMTAFANLGLQVEVTEMDVAAAGLMPLRWRLERQAQIYAAAGRACRALPACTRFTVWGVSDRFSWLTPAQLPLLFDAGLRPKPALSALQQALA